MGMMALGLRALVLLALAQVVVAAPTFTGAVMQPQIEKALRNFMDIPFHRINIAMAASRMGFL